MDTPFSEAWIAWFESEEGQKCCDSTTMGIMDPKYFVNRLHTAFAAAWNAKPSVGYAPYESTVIAISTDAGYEAMHERIQEGWEPLLVWTDKHGEHMTLRRLRV